VTVENLNLSHTTVGVELSHTNNVVISGNNITANAAEGIWFDSSNNNIASGNNITNNGYGISLGSSSNNNVNGNNITNNIYGFYLTFASNRNTIYHNDLMNNTNQVTSFDSTNIWDDGYPSGGNYWSDYNGTDANHDGIGDTLYTIAANNTDNYPLMGTLYSFTIFAFSPWSNMSLTIISNSSVTNPFFVYALPPFWSLEGPEMPLLVFSVNGGIGAVCFCRLIMPKAFFLNSSTYIVFVDAQPINATVLTPTLNSTQAYLYFTYTNSTHQVVVTVPEFSSFLALPLFMVATLIVIAFYKKKSIPYKRL
jgi:parallel beta-helix repeat protein